MSVLGDIWDAGGDALGDGAEFVVDTVARSRLRKITSALSVSVLGVSFIDNPQGFVIASIIDWILGFMFGVAGEVALVIQESVIGTFVDAVVSAFAVALDPFGLAGDLVVDLVGVVEDLAVGLAASAGPFGFLAPVVAWALVAVAVAALVAFLRRVVLWLT